MLTLGIDIGTSSVKVAVVDTFDQKCIATAQFPETEAAIKSIQSGWAEQNPIDWWYFTQQAILKIHAQKKYSSSAIKAIGITYQMHGLVCVDKHQKLLRDSIIWCDSRAIVFGEEAFESIGHEKCLQRLLNSPGNFTAAKLAWVKQNEPAVYEKIVTVMLPGDFIAMQLTGEITTSAAALSEGIFWDFEQKELSKDILQYFGFDASFFPAVKQVFDYHGTLSNDAAKLLSLTPSIPITYKAGDQPNNALSLNVLNPGEVSATAGTSGVIYGISNALTYDKLSRFNAFAHVNYSNQMNSIGTLLCINGTGILNRWIKQIAGTSLTYQQMNDAAQHIKIGSNGLSILPFGNGAERMLQNKLIQSHVHYIDFNIHTKAHLFRAAQEGIAFAFRYGLDIMRENGIKPNVIKAGYANMFLSNVFTESFVNATGVTVTLYQNDGSVSAALGAAIGAGFYSNATEAFSKSVCIKSVEPSNTTLYNELYFEWKKLLELQMQQFPISSSKKI